jgi:hypothetical protein
MFLARLSSLLYLAMVFLNQSNFFIIDKLPLGWGLTAQWLNLFFGVSEGAIWQRLSFLVGQLLSFFNIE